jgi:NADPH:quinone reductase-like Zn-dependent oxidoreductase
VNLLDSKISSEFKLILPYRMPLILGNDVAGDVVEVGPGVRRFNVGDEVYARPDKGAIGTFAELIAMNEADVALKPVSTTRRRAKRLAVDYSFLFMRANGAQLTEITSLIDAGTIRPILDRVAPFASTNEAIAYVEPGRAKGKIVVTTR